VLPAPSLADLLLAIALVILGFCFWNWSVLFSSEAGAGATAFFLLALVVSFLYLQARGIRQNAQSLLLLLVAVSGSVPFVLNGTRDINFCLLAFEACACLLWLMYSCRTNITDKLSGFLLGDLINQTFIIPFANFKHLFTQPFRRPANRAQTALPIKRALIGVICCIPVFALVVWLLALSDTGFRVLIEHFTEHLAPLDITRYVFEFLFGIPVAAYIFGALFGNAMRLHHSHLTLKRSQDAFDGAHILPKAALYAPLALFVLLYLVYFIAMGSYLFSGLQNRLPEAYTYAEYARRGFFELCGVATINLIILAGIWLFAKRTTREYPPPLRLLSGLLTLLTCLLVVTAASKMLLYIQTYGLTPLRVYTIWFMALMLLVFLALVIWHIRPANVARPIIVLVIVFILGLGLTDTNGLIAEHNVGRYLSGQTDKIDSKMLASLGDAAVPALSKLQEESTDAQVREEAANALNTIMDQPYPSMITGQSPQPGWPQWNLQSFEATKVQGG
jgi:hypothetical protein